MPTIPLALAYFTTSLSGSITDSATSIQLADDPGQSNGYITIDRDNASTREVIKFTTNTGGLIGGLTRALDGTTAQAHGNEAAVQMGPIAAQFNELTTEVNTNSHAPNTDTGTTSTTWIIDSGGDSVTLDSTGLTADRVFTFPDTAGELALAGGTLTNVTMNGTVSGTAIVTTLGTPGVDTLLASEKAIRDAITASVAGVASWNGETGAVSYDPILQVQVFL